MLEGIGLLPYLPYHPARFEQCWEEIGKIWNTVNNQTASRQDEQGMEDLSITLYRLLLMLRRSESIHSSGSRLELESVRNEALAKAVELINEHYTEPLLISI